MTIILWVHWGLHFISPLPGLFHPADLWVAATLVAIGLLRSGTRWLAVLLLVGLLVALFPTGMLFGVLLAVIALGLLRQTKTRGPVLRLGSRWGHLWPVTLTTTDRYMHTHVLGPTGSGKSSAVLMPFIQQDLAFGHGLALIEPKGDLSLAVYRRSRALGRTTVYFDPHQPTCPHINPLSGPADVAAEGLSWALNQISEAGHPFYAVSARVQLMYTVMAVKEAFASGADLTHVLDFLRQDAFRKKVLADVSDRRVLAYFREQMGQINQSRAQEQRQGLLNRLELLLVNPDVRRVLTGSSDFTWDQVLEENLVVICPISLARLGESARMLGTLLWHGLAMATYRRATHGASPFFLYLDEFHQYVTPDLGDFLALARGYSVGLVLAHQDMGQLRPELREALLANARQRVVLGAIAADDLKTVMALAKPHPVNENLRYMSRGDALVQLTRHGRLMPPCTLSLPYVPLDGS